MQGPIGFVAVGVSHAPRSITAVLSDSYEFGSTRLPGILVWEFDGIDATRRIYAVPKETDALAQPGATLSFSGEGNWVGVKYTSIDVLSSGIAPRSP